MKSALPSYGTWLALPRLLALLFPSSYAPKTRRATATTINSIDTVVQSNSTNCISAVVTVTIALVVVVVTMVIVTTMEEVVGVNVTWVVEVTYGTTLNVIVSSRNQCLLMVECSTQSLTV